MFLSLVVAFGAGVISFLAPCTVPLLPAYVGVLSGAGRGVAEEEQRRRLFTGSLLYVVGFSTVFVALGLAVGSAGRAVREPGGAVQRIGGVVVLLFAVLLLTDGRNGLLARLTTGGSWVGSARARLAASGSRFAPLLLGMVFATAFTPCVGPFLGAVLTLGALEGASLRSGALLGAYSLGLGVPFVFAALSVASSPRLARTLNRFARPMSLVGGGLLVVLGLLLVSGKYGVLAGWLIETLPFPAT
jgi:cytochrome c-type biogenesis protein